MPKITECEAKVTTSGKSCADCLLHHARPPGFISFSPIILGLSSKDQVDPLANADRQV